MHVPVLIMQIWTDNATNLHWKIFLRVLARVQTADFFLQSWTFCLEHETCFFCLNGFNSGQSGMTSAKLVFLVVGLGVARVCNIYSMYIMYTMFNVYVCSMYKCKQCVRNLIEKIFITSYFLKHT